MFSGLLISSVAVLYLALLFAVAWFGDRPAGRKLARSPWVYSLSLAVYCTAWTFYGSVGRAADDGIGFLPIYLGPTLAAALAWVLLRKMVRVSKRERIISIADFLAARYGKSRRLGALVTVIAVLGTVPYIALQLKAVATSYLVLTGDRASLLATSFFVAAVLAAFAIVFGTRDVDLTEQRGGLVLAIAFESVVKLVAFLAVGLWVVYGLHDGPGALMSEALGRAELAQLASFEVRWATWSFMVLIAWSAFLFLPRQFHVAVVENADEQHVRTASWALPLYLLAINLFVLPIALAGRLRFDGTGVDADTFVLSLPLTEGQATLALLVFLGGLSAAAGMVVVETVALSTMVAHDLVLPLVLRPALGDGVADGSAVDGPAADDPVADGPAADDPVADLGALLLTIRRLAIVGVLALGYLYLYALGFDASLVSIGLVSFAAIAQLAPAVLGGLYWTGATRAGAMAGLGGGFAVWAYTLPLPNLVEAGHLPAAWLESGPFGLAWLRPQALFGLEGLDPISHAMLWSLVVNVGAYLAVSALAPPSHAEASQARRFVDVFQLGGGPGLESSWRGHGRAETPLEAVRSLLVRFLGVGRTERALGDYFEQRERPRVADGELLAYAERLLAGTTGAASAHVALRSVAEEDLLQPAEVVSLLDETSRVLATKRELEQKSHQLERVGEQLRLANRRLLELDRVKDDFLATMTHELRTPLTSIRAFTEILHDHPELDVEKRRQFLAVVLEENERLTRLVDQVLDLAKLEDGAALAEGQFAGAGGVSSSAVAPSPGVDCAGLIERAVAIFAARFEKRGIRFERRIAADLPRVDADVDRTVQVLVNLLSNALRYGRGSVLVEAAAVQGGTRGQVRIAVEDDGPGVPEPQRQLVFEKFHQVSTSPVSTPGRSRGKGSGLGLAICRAIVERHGGEIGVSRSAAGGARFYFTLPVSDPESRRQAGHSGENGVDKKVGEE